MGAVVYNSIVAVVMLTQLACWIAYMKLQTVLSSPSLSYDFYDNRESSRARFLLPYKVNNASSAAQDVGGDDAFAGNLRWPLQTNNTGLDTFAAMMHSFNVLRSLQVTCSYDCGQAVAQSCATASLQCSCQCPTVAVYQQQHFILVLDSTSASRPLFHKLKHIRFQSASLTLPSPTPFTC